MSPIPPGCATNYQTWDLFNPSDKEVISTGTYPSASFPDGLAQNVQYRIWRKGCTNSNRAVIMMDLTVVDNNNGQMDCAPTPKTEAVLPNGDIKMMRTINEPNTYFGFEGARLVCETTMFTLFVDTASVLRPNATADDYIKASDYNGDWTLVMEDLLTGARQAVDIPAYTGNLSTPRIAFTGRLGGNWAVPGARDQGFLISFNELTDPTVGVLFVSWYTFDKDGNLLWLTGNANYSWGDTEATFDIQLVENGVFMGSKVADRRSVGPATLVALGCNNLQFSYDLNELGLGSATKSLVRIVSLEPQGYVCSDNETRRLHVNDY